MDLVRGVSVGAGVRWGRRWSDRAREERRRTGAFEPPAPGLPAAAECVEELRSRRPRPRGPFLAQLLAERLGLRQRRDSAAPDEAGATYRASDLPARGAPRGALVRRDI